MKSNFTLFLNVVISTVLLFSIPIQSQVITDGSLVFGAWTLANSPYTIEGEAIIPVDSTLTIEAGVELRFKTGSDYDYTGGVDVGFMRVNGKLVARGSSANWIKFTRDGDSGNWGIIYFEDSSDDGSILEYCKLEYGNRIDNISGTTDFIGVISTYSASPTIINCTIRHNTRGIHGYWNSTPRLINNAITDNSEHGIYLYYYSHAKIYNNTIANNSGNGLYNTVSSSPVLKSNIIWGNSNSINVISGSPKMSYCLIHEENLPNRVVDEGNNILGYGPQFLDDVNGDYRIGLNSFGVENGTADTTGLGLPETDLWGNARLVNGVVDIGAYEYQGLEYVRLVSPNGDEAWMGGLSQPIRWESNVGDVKLEYSIDGGVIWNVIESSTANDGEYIWTVPGVESATCLVRVSAASNAGLMDVSDAPFFIYTSILPDGSRVFGTWTLANSPYTIQGEVIIPADSLLTIEAGVELRFKTGSDYDYTGGVDVGFMRVKGKLVAQGSYDNRIRFTRDGDSGNWGIIYFEDSSDDGSILEYCELEYGNRIDNISGTTDFIGVISTYSASPTIINCTIRHNTRGIHGYWNSTPRLINNAITDNSEHGIYLYYYSHAKIYNNTIANNSGNGLYNTVSSSPVLKNNIIWGNSSSINVISGSPKLSYCLIQEVSLPTGVVDEGNNIFAQNPLFLNVGDYPYTYKKASPCTNAGTPDTTGLALPETDLAGKSRIFDSRIDIGAHEYNSLLEILDTPTFYPEAGIYFTEINVGISSNEGATIYYTKDGSDPTMDDFVYSDSIHLSSSTLLKARAFMDGWDPSLVNSIEYEIDLIGTPIQGEVSGIWIKSNSPYVVTGDITVPYDSLLIIEPGVKILFYSDYEFIISGTLNAVGTELDSIIFTSYSSHKVPGSWGGIHFTQSSSANLSNINPDDTKETCSKRAENSDAVDEKKPSQQNVDREHLFTAEKSLLLNIDSSTLSYCRVEYARTGITAERDEVAIEYCIVKNNSEHGVMWHGDEVSASGKLLYSVIKNNGGWGVYCMAECSEDYGYASPNIEGNQIIGNISGGIYLYADGDSPYSWYGTVDRAYVSPEIKNNKIANNNGNALECLSWGVFTDGIPLDHRSYAHTNPTLTYNVLANNAGGVKITCPNYNNSKGRLSQAEVTIDRNTFWSNGSTFIDAADSSEVRISNTIDWGPSASTIETSTGAEVNVVYSDLYESYPGEGNISLNPEFVDPYNDDFHLSPNSPCIDAGDPNSPKDPDSTRADMGAYYYDSGSVSVTFDFSEPGWYLISLPILPADSSVTTLFPTALGAFDWNVITNTYTEVFKIEPKKGYWLAIPEKGTTIVSGMALNNYTRHFADQGWHLIGSVIDPVDFTNPNDNPDGAVIGCCGWDAQSASYYHTTTLEPDHGYWIAVMEACDLIIGDEILPGKLTKAKANAFQFYQKYGSQPPAPPTFSFDDATNNGIPQTYELFQNYPNPFNAQTVIKYQLPEAGKVSLKIYNILDQEVKTLINEEKPAGYYKAIWDGCNNHGNLVSSGLYFYRIEAGEFSSIKKMLILK